MTLFMTFRGEYYLPGKFFLKIPLPLFMKSAQTMLPSSEFSKCLMHPHLHWLLHRKARSPETCLTRTQQSPVAVPQHPQCHSGRAGCAWRLVFTRAKLSSLTVSLPPWRLPSQTSQASNTPWRDCSRWQEMSEMIILSLCLFIPPAEGREQTLTSLIHN